MSARTGRQRRISPGFDGVRGAVERPSVGAYADAPADGGRLRPDPRDQPTPGQPAGRSAKYDSVLRSFVDEIQAEVNPRLLRLGMHRGGGRPCRSWAASIGVDLAGFWGGTPTRGGWFLEGLGLSSGDQRVASPARSGRFALMAGQLSADAGFLGRLGVAPFRARRLVMRVMAAQARFLAYETSRCRQRRRREWRATSRACEARG